MTTAAERATRLAMAISETMNCAAFVLVAPESAQGTMGDPAQRGELLRTTLHGLLAVLEEVGPEDLSGPPKFDGGALHRGASELLNRLDPWDYEPPAPPPVMEAFGEMMSAMGLTEQQYRAMIDSVGAGSGD